MDITETRNQHTIQSPDPFIINNDDSYNSFLTQISFMIAQLNLFKGNVRALYS